MIGLAVIEQQLFSRLDVSQSEEEDVAVNDLAVAVGFAGVIYVLRAVAAETPVYRPIKVDAADVEPSFVFETARDFVAGDSFALVFGDLAPLFKSDSGETASAVNL
jgi:hypothetical protein